MALLPSGQHALALANRLLETGDLAGADHVMIGRGNHSHHELYPQNKFFLPEKSPNLLQQ